VLRGEPRPTFRVGHRRGHRPRSWLALGPPVLGTEADGGRIPLDGGELNFVAGERDGIAAFHVEGLGAETSIGGVRFVPARTAPASRLDRHGGRAAPVSSALFGTSSSRFTCTRPQTPGDEPERRWRRSDRRDPRSPATAAQAGYVARARSSGLRRATWNVLHVNASRPPSRHGAGARAVTARAGENPPRRLA
jgi:hypothetical protein